MSIDVTTLVPTIICGGVGSRLWPVSRELLPKPFIRLDDGQSLLQKAYSRGAELANTNEVVTVTNRELLFKIEDEYQECLPNSGAQIRNTFILEPFGRNTAPAIASATLQIAQEHGRDAIVLVLAADHLISGQQEFVEAVVKACDLALTGKIVTFGIKPSIPENEYGYIEYEGCDVTRFVEKPDLSKAQEYIAAGRFLWNSGMFCFMAASMLEQMEEHCPYILEQTRFSLKNARKAEGKNHAQIEIHSEHFDIVPNDSIDYAVMEKTSNAAVVACDIGWSDVGCWKALGDLTSPDSNSNRIQGDVLAVDSNNCTIKGGDRVVAAVGLSNLVIVDTPDALLVSDKQRSHEVKNIYAQLKERDHTSHKVHRTAHRPWGTYTVLEEGDSFKIKRIEVKPGASLSLQMHRHRSEHWVVVSGTAKVLNNDQELTLNVNESTFIPAEHKHRLENIGLKVLVLIEVQTGSYLGEDDIVRFKDIYGRVT